MTTRWYCAATYPAREHFAAQNVIEAGYNVFLPRYAVTVKGKPETRALFAGYLFVALDLDRPWVGVNFARGIKRLLPIHSQIPLPVQQGVIEDMMAAADDGLMEVESAEKILIDYAVGTEMRVKSGAFGGLTGKYLGRNGERMQLLLSLLGRQVSVTFRADQVAAY